MARPSRQQASSDEGLSDGYEEEEQQQLNEPVNEEDEEELEAVARSASSADADENGEAEEEEDDEVPCLPAPLFYYWISWNFLAPDLLLAL
ncbi:ISWI chromatin-remodeling complex ATPase CHR17-like [Rhodamnia argentea]|uniref:ISWI chromatin-remodeling complex ATPase CHR17-like n=1 Tax=Rhodamnia argentea TaxID=178133 RepID=A0ABM3GXZ5_9MYRT|nr:ISWI chromatin-remodeling complex ATPase CHR17-like [Rhodamnia argentea]